MTKNVPPSTLAKLAKLVKTQHPVAVQVEAHFRRSCYAALRSLTCDYHEGVVTIRGHVPSYYLKQLAQVSVQELFPTLRISNCAEVVTPPACSRPADLDAVNCRRPVLLRLNAYDEGRHAC